MAGRLLAHAVDADMAGLDQRGGAGAGLHHPRMPQPFIETLALQATPSERFRDRCPDSAGNRVTCPCGRLSCSFSAASLANGEFGSIGRSRSRGGALVAYCRCDGRCRRLSRPPLSRPPVAVATLVAIALVASPPSFAACPCRRRRVLALEALARRTALRRRRAVSRTGAPFARRGGRARFGRRAGRGLRKSLWRSRRPRR